MQQAGLPDRILIHRYLPRPAFLEMKNDDNKLSAKQYYMHKEINDRCPHTAFVVRFKNEIISIEYQDTTLVLCTELTFIDELKKVM
jgi:hypothetical protein